MDKGLHWSLLSRGLEDASISDLQVDLRDGSVLYKASESYGLFRSDDAGVTWRDIRPSSDDHRIPVIVLHPSTPDLLYAVSKESQDYGVWRSLDGGTTWTSPGEKLASVISLAVDPDDTRVVYAGTERTGLFKSLDQGESWEQFGLVDYGYINVLAVNPSKAAQVLAGTDRGVHISPNGGNTWKITGLETPEANAIRFSQDGSTVLAATTSGIFQSGDGGLTWAPLGPNRSISDLVIDLENPQRILAGSRFGVLRKEPGEFTWRPSNEGLDSARVRSFVLDPRRPGTIYAGSNGVVATSSDQGETWRNSELAPDVPAGAGRVSALVLDPVRPDTVYAGTRTGIFRSRNAGLDWEPANTGLTNPRVEDLKIDASGRLYVAMGEILTIGGWFAGFDGGVFVSDDGGETFVLSGFEGGFSSCLAVDPSGPVYAIRGAVWRSDDKGQSWVRVGPDERPDSLRLYPEPCSLLIHSQRPGVLYLGIRAGAFKSEDGGVSWKSINSGLEQTRKLYGIYAQSLAAHPKDPEVLYVATNRGVYETRNGGRRWFPITQGLPLSSVGCIGIHPQKTDSIYSCPVQGGLFEYTTATRNPDLRHSTYAPLLREQGDQFTGAALVNLDDTTASVQLTAHRPDGSLFNGANITNPAKLEILPGEQRVLLGEGIWGEGLREVSGTGWIRVDSSSPRVLGLFAVGNSGPSRVGGGQFEFLGLDFFVLPEVGGDAPTRLWLANPNPQPVQARLNVLNRAGRLRGNTFKVEIPASGLLSRELREMFGNISLQDSDFIQGSLSKYSVNP